MGGWGDGPPKFEARTAHVSVLAIFLEVVLLDACESMNRVKKGVKEFLSETEVFLVKKGQYMSLHIRVQTLKRQAKTEKTRSMTKIRSSKFSASKWKFVPKKVVLKFWSVKFFLIPKLGAKSAPMI